MWKNTYGDYRRAPDRTPSRPNIERFSRSSTRNDSRNSSSRSDLRNRDSSKTRSKTETPEEKEEVREHLGSMEKNIEDIIIDVKKLSEEVEKQVKAKNVSWIKSIQEDGEIEVKINNVRFSREVKDKEGMIVDTGCPSSIVREEWLKEYLEKRDMMKNKLKKVKCSQKFKFGPSKVYEATELVEIPMTVKLNDNEESFKKITIEAFIVGAEDYCVAEIQWKNGQL
jgi:hypothetical protein